MLPMTLLTVGLFPVTGRLEICFQAICYRMRFLIHLGTDKISTSCKHEQGIIHKSKNDP